MPKNKKDEYEITGNVTAESLKKTKIYKEIKNGLYQQLQFKNAYIPVFISLVEDYMNLWVTKELLAADIRKRGVIVTYNNGGGQEGTKSNDSVDKQHRVSAQMTKLLAEMDIKTNTIIRDGDDEL